MLRFATTVRHTASPYALTGAVVLSQAAVSTKAGFPPSPKVAEHVEKERLGREKRKEKLQVVFVCISGLPTLECDLEAMTGLYSRTLH